MVAITSTAPAGGLIRFVLVDLSLRDTGQCFTVVLELLFPVALGCVGRFSLFPTLVRSTVGFLVFVSLPLFPLLLGFRGGLIHAK
jgi:hypothetical protein